MQFHKNSCVDYSRRSFKETATLTHSTLRSSINLHNASTSQSIIAFMKLKNEYT